MIFVSCERIKMKLFFKKPVFDKGSPKIAKGTVRWSASFQRITGKTLREKPLLSQYKSPSGVNTSMSTEVWDEASYLYPLKSVFPVSKWLWMKSKMQQPTNLGPQAGMWLRHLASWSLVRMGRGTRRETVPHCFTVSSSLSNELWSLIGTALGHSLNFS